MNTMNDAAGIADASARSPGRGSPRGRGTVERPRGSGGGPATTTGRVYESLRTSIMSGQFAPGQTLTIRTLASRFGTSPMPVREAMGRLIAENALEMRPNRSVIVPQLTRPRLEELKHIRVKLESSAVEEAARLMSQRQLASLVRINEELRQARDIGEVLSLHTEFHLMVYNAAGMPLLARLIEHLWLQVGPTLNLFFSKQLRLEQHTALDLRHHDALIAAIEARDPAGAGLAVVCDIADGLDFIERLAWR